MSTMIVQGVFRVKPEERDAYLAASVETMKNSRAEAGCLEYVLAADPLDEGRVILSERWESAEDLDAHGQALAARRKEAAERGEEARPAPLSVQITVYEVASEQALA